jgi:predicted amidohydrolase YtcJ
LSPAPDEPHGAASADAPAIFLRNARIRTMDAACPLATAFLARAGRFVATGDEEELARLPEARDAREVDAGGRLVTPGLIDAHTHLVPASRRATMLDLTDAATLEAASSAVAARHAALAPGAWLVGGGHAMLRWSRRPERSDLDRAAPGRAVFVRAKDGHSAWVSSAALAAAGVTRDTRDPEGGRIGRDAAGEPDGLLYENALALVESRLPEGDERDADDALRAMLARLNAVGVTGAHDLQGYAAFRAYARLRAAGALSVRVWMGFSVGVLADATGPPLEEAIALALRENDDRLAVGAIKCFLDGSLGSRTAHLLEPYAGHDDRGIETLTADELDRLGEIASRLGVTVCAHAIGDAAVRAALDGFERWTAEDRVRLRPRIEHAQLIDESDFERFAALGVVASMQPQHAASDRPTAEALLGERDARGGYAWRRLMDEGAALAFGSDVPVETCDPRAGLHAAVTGGDAAAHAAGKTPARAISLGEALYAYTAGAAQAAHMEGLAGVIAPEAYADFVVWDDDLDAMPVERLPGAKVGSTWVGGVEV